MAAQRCKILQNEYLLARIGADTAGLYTQRSVPKMVNYATFDASSTHFSWPSLAWHTRASQSVKNIEELSKRALKSSRLRQGRQRSSASARSPSELELCRNFGKISANCCSFSAVSAPIFARKHAFCSIFQNLPDYQAEIFEIKFWQNFANFETFAKFLLNFHENC